MALRLPDDWLALVARVPIENCEPKVGRRCPLRWESLEPTEAMPRERFCRQCGEHVHWCEDIGMAKAHAAQGRCVALDERILRRANDLDAPPEQEEWMGQMDPDWE